MKITKCTTTVFFIPFFLFPPKKEEEEKRMMGKAGFNQVFLVLMRFSPEYNVFQKFIAHIFGRTKLFENKM